MILIPEDNLQEESSLTSREAWPQTSETPNLAVSWHYHMPIFSGSVTANNNLRIV